MNIQKALIIIGLLLLILGISYPLIKNLPFGKLPGDFVFKSKNISFYFPLMTCILISILITFLMKLFR